MKTHSKGFDEVEVIHSLKHYLPAQAPLKDFIHHNTLHAFQHEAFHEGLVRAAEIFGYNVSLSIHDFRRQYKAGKIKDEALKRAIASRNSSQQAQTQLYDELLNAEYPYFDTARIGTLRSKLKRQVGVDLDTLVQPILFRILCSYLDQGISMWDFPVAGAGFLDSIREMERNTFSSFFRSKRARNLLVNHKTDIRSLLQILVGPDENCYAQYLFDQQFSHQGWSGMVSAVEDFPEGLLDTKQISLKELIILELLLEIDALDAELGPKWKPMMEGADFEYTELFAPIVITPHRYALSIWQDAYENSYYDEVLTAMLLPQKPIAAKNMSFQAMFCIDDRECSFRRYLESADPHCETFSTPGFFGVEFFFQPSGGKFHTKLCPAPVTPKYLVKEVGGNGKMKKDLAFSKNSHKLARGWLITQTLGFWSAVRLAQNIFRPRMSPATASSFAHMNKVAKLTIENTTALVDEGGLQVGFRIDEMVTRVENLLLSIGMVKDFAPIVYVIGHGASSINNPHFAAYDCGACCGRPGSVNARVFCYMANHTAVREALKTRGIAIPPATQFVGGLHDTTRDEIQFYDEEELSAPNQKAHAIHGLVFEKALQNNAKERSRRLQLVNTRMPLAKLHEKIKLRSVSLFEPRPELNHATNTLCIVGPRAMTKHLFLDRRSFLNSYNCRVDPEGNALFGILKAAAPVCGGINLEYYFSRTDNQKLGAGSKLPHNVMGLFGVANGADGDLRPGLPNQMIEVHDPMRLLIVVEHYPDVVMHTIQRHEETYQWFLYEWVHLVVIHPVEKRIYRYSKGEFVPYTPINIPPAVVNDLGQLIETQENNLPVHLISQAL
jgi:uncharacterized protein YbcC (UPF0753/DUF2309 family)